MTDSPAASQYPLTRIRKEASEVRAESPQELEKTISELEQNPELIDTMAE